MLPEFALSTMCGTAAMMLWNSASYTFRGFAAAWVAEP
jgi:hypothetical protein